MKRTQTTTAKQNVADRQADPAASDPTGPAGEQVLPLLARRMIRWSSNLLATAVILILGLTLGRQVLHWWHDAPPADRPADGSEDRLAYLADPHWPHRLTFGDLPTVFDRVSFTGSEQAALERLRAACRELARSQHGVSGTGLPAKRRVLQQLAECEPVERGRGWRLVQHVGPVITVVALRIDETDTAEPTGDISQNHVSVVSWGLGLRSTESSTDEAISHSRWTLYICSGPTGATASDAAHVIPLPPRSQRTFTAEVAGSGGGALVGFSGPDSCSSFRAFFDRSLLRRNWLATAGWEQVGQGWHARFKRPDGSTCDIQLIRATNRETSGILTIQLTDLKQGKQTYESGTGPRGGDRAGRGGSGL